MRVGEGRRCPGARGVSAGDPREASQTRLKRFVADASHELRTPVTAVQGYAELYRTGGLPPGEPLDRAMARIESESRRMARLVEDLLLLARLDQQQPLEQEPVDVAGVARDAVADLPAVEPDRTVTVAAPAHAMFEGDDARLQQVLGNLLTNARVHTPPNTPIHVSVETAGPDVVLRVSYEGPGIPPEHQARLFERFYRADPSDY